MGLQLKMGGKFLLRLNNGKRPIANKYREGKMKSTLKRELKAREIVKRETLGAQWSRVPGSPVLASAGHSGRAGGQRRLREGCRSRPGKVVRAGLGRPGRL